MGEQQVFCSTCSEYRSPGMIVAGHCHGCGEKLPEPRADMQMYPVAPPPPAFKVGDRVQSRGGEVVTVTELMTYAGKPAVRAKYNAERGTGIWFLHEIEHVPAPIAPTRTPSEAKGALLDQWKQEMLAGQRAANAQLSAIANDARARAQAQYSGQAQAIMYQQQMARSQEQAAQRGCYAPGLNVSKSLAPDPIAAAKAKCADVEKRAAQMLGTGVAKPLSHAGGGYVVVVPCDCGKRICHPVGQVDPAELACGHVFERSRYDDKIVCRGCKLEIRGEALRSLGFDGRRIEKSKPSAEPLPDHRPTFACAYCRTSTEHADSQAGMRCCKCSAVYMGVQHAALEAPYQPVRGKR